MKQDTDLLLLHTLRHLKPFFKGRCILIAALIPLAAAGIQSFWFLRSQEDAMKAIIYPPFRIAHFWLFSMAAIINSLLVLPISRFSSLKRVALLISNFVM